MNDKTQPYFVRIKNPNQTRKDILLSIRGTLQLLQKQDKLDKIRIEKIKEISNLKNDVREAQKLIIALKKNLPITQVIAQKKTQDKKFPKKEENKKRYSDDVNKLQRQLSDIEGKLNRIS